MHSVRQSRSRVLFEVFCALAMSASFAGAWIQTGASALLGAAGVAALYGLVHMFDLGGRKPQAMVDQPEIEHVQEVAAQPPVASEPVEAVVAVEEVERAEPVAPRKRRASGAKSRRKDAASQADLPVEEAVAEDAVPAEAEVAPAPSAEVTHLHIEPLFEAEPFTRMPRPAFGRKAG